MATASRRGSRRGSTAEKEPPARSSRRGSASRRGSRRDEEPEVDDLDDSEDEEPEEDDDDEPRARGRGSRRGSSSRGSGRSSGRGSRRGRGSQDDEDDKPRRRRSASSEDEGPKRSRGRRGWDAAEEQKEITKSSGGDYVPKEMIWKPDEEPTLVKFVEDAPFVSYAQHWINSAPKSRKGWECIAPLPYEGDDTDKYGEVGDCPLCEAFDDSPRMQVMFNVIIFNEDIEDWEYRVLRAGVTLSDQLKALNDGRHGPLSKYYWEVSATGTKGSYSPNCSVVKDRDLPDDWDLDPLTDKEMDDLLEEAFDESIVSFPTERQLEDLLDEMLE